MTDRADALARKLVRVLPDGDGRPGIDIAGTWFEWDGCHEEIQSVADETAAKLATALRAYAEEARREERVVAAAHAQMRYEDGYDCGVRDEQERWAS